MKNNLLHQYFYRSENLSRCLGINGAEKGSHWYMIRERTLKESNSISGERCFNYIEKYLSRFNRPPQMVSISR